MKMYEKKPAKLSFSPDAKMLYKTEEFFFFFCTFLCRLQHATSWQQVAMPTTTQGAMAMPSQNAAATATAARVLSKTR